MIDTKRWVETGRAVLRRSDVRRALPIAGALALGVAGGAVLANGEGPSTTVGADQFTPAQRKAIEAMIRQYVLDNGAIIPEAINRMQEREVVKLLDSNRDEIEKPFAGAWAGARDPDVTVVEFFDYACGYCRQMVPEIARLIKDDPKVRIVWRDFPVLTPASEEAAMASLSAAKQGKYRAFHSAMFATRPTHETVIATVRKARLNEVQTARDLNAPALKAEIKKNHDLGRALGLTGTPSYIIGDRILSGAVGYDELKKAVAEARAKA